MLIALYRRSALVRLCETAKVLDLEVITKTDDYRDMDMARRTAQLIGSAVILQSVIDVQNCFADRALLCFDLFDE